jgi:hypothetical protein
VVVNPEGVPEEIACLDAVEEEDPVPEITRFVIVLFLF